MPPQSRRRSRKTGAAGASKSAVDSVLLGFDGRRQIFELRDPFQRASLESRGIAGDGRLSSSGNLGNPPVERRDQLAQLTDDGQGCQRHRRPPYRSCCDRETYHTAGQAARRQSRLTSRFLEVLTPDSDGPAEHCTSRVTAGADVRSKTGCPTGPPGTCFGEGWCRNGPRAQESGVVRQVYVAHGAAGRRIREGVIQAQIRNVPECCIVVRVLPH
jgi:hypothetical protein